MRELSRWVFLVTVCHPCPASTVQKVSRDFNVSFWPQNLLPCQHYFLPHAIIRPQLCLTLHKTQVLALQTLVCVATETQGG